MYGISISQRKYVLDLLSRIRMLECKPIFAHTDPNSSLMHDQRELLHDPRRRKKIIGKLNHLSVTHPDIVFPVSVVSQFISMSGLRAERWNVIVRIQ